MSRFSLVLIPILLCSSAWATNINLSGKIIASPCIVTPDTADKLVEFDQLDIRDLSVAGSGGSWKDFQLVLTDCPISATKATVKFSGTPDDDDTTAFMNVGTSDNVALRLTDRARAISYSNDSDITVNVASDRTATFPLSARIITPTGSATGGTFSSVISLGFTYQ